MSKELQERIKKLGLKSSRIGGSGSMRLKLKKKRPNRDNNVNTDKIEECNVDTEIENLEQQLDNMTNKN
jgi:hypothetical protein